jgi:hypothetical protein
MLLVEAATIAATTTGASGIPVASQGVPCCWVEKRVEHSEIVVDIPQYAWCLSRLVLRLHRPHPPLVVG